MIDEDEEKLQWFFLSFSDAYHVFSAAGSVVYAWRRGSELKHTYGGGAATAPIHLILPFGPHLITIDTE